MINNVVLVGRLTRDIEVRKTPSGLSHTRFTIACDRRFRSQDANAPTADFISCVAWRQQADFLGSYARKGSIVAVEGHITTGSYDGPNGKVYTTDVTCENVRLIGGNRDNQQSTMNNTMNTQRQTYTPTTSNVGYDVSDDFSNTPSLDISSDDLPFY